MLRFLCIILLACLAAGCVPKGDLLSESIADVRDRPLTYPDYPRGNVTYLSFSAAHGFQVNYIRGDGKAWLWYPGNTVVVPEMWKIEGGGTSLCWSHPSNSYNPVTRETGGGFTCSPRLFTARTVVAHLPGDPFKLSSGKIPYRLGKCDAPKAFSFDRTRFHC
ncbi:hypothetical protein SAMN05216376_117100 [Mameliella alba]|uniref:hypothetical protein n=1 Tax=Mameliella alba TaxID=561184 RepID=UPI000888B8AF|nr:hypothetical protein [Mameliella alba]OWV42807.1 hypothetical protein CDZ96_23250 [Mameliella alba]PTR35819.1 hypothetical protein LX94_04461 [Mameliella alba]GGF81955.1 hypothetical protein GCM10011319_47530 [Mameliella alba]SDE09845.1 hypothetical protein SAMN05216376_117100 [Mameliella alba]